KWHSCGSSVGGAKNYCDGSTAPNKCAMSVPWPTISSVLSRCSFSTSNKCFRTGSGCRQVVDLQLPCPLTKPKSDCSAVSRSSESGANYAPHWCIGSCCAQKSQQTPL